MASDLAAGGKSATHGQSEGHLPHAACRRANPARRFESIERNASPHILRVDALQHDESLTF
ncbi:hypothetical protein A6V36_29965 [Paraburkholderia ginsengiterrae]|uniref:Uncharacterized protein n=1 Tax=Paraburkholderia ginsengiterrae TaxID=1462993 RepID=A0A1A9N287_9BURK|nr:hypothetical protein A6V37_32490 [Paraburkholderia ginsengiterrae]OAJ58644.1 hypothetical protein A6V36_29965 [Paraburkholderia ginsengiterrae]